MSLKNPVTPPGIDPETVRKVVQRLNHYTTPGPLKARSIKIKIHVTLTLPVILYGCETWSLALRPEHMVRVVKNRMLRKTAGSKGMR